MRTILSLFVVLLFVASCGGGSGQEAVAPIEPSEPPTQEETTEPDMPESEEGEPETPVEPTESSLCESAQIDDETVIEFLNALFDTESTEVEESTRVVRWNIAPTLRMAEDTSDRNREIVKEAVGRLNSALPDGYDITVETDVSSRSTDKVPEGEIHVDFGFTDEGHWGGNCRRENGYPFGCADTNYSINHEDPSMSEIKSAHVWTHTFDKGFFRLCAEEAKLSVMTHELLHTLGFRDHVNRPQWGAISIMTRGGGCTRFDIEEFIEEELIPASIPGPVDCATLKAMYSRLENGDYPEELRNE